MTCVFQHQALANNRPPEDKFFAIMENSHLLVMPAQFGQIELLVPSQLLGGDLAKEGHILKVVSAGTHQPRRGSMFSAYAELSTSADRVTQSEEPTNYSQRYRWRNSQLPRGPFGPSNDR